MAGLAVGNTAGVRGEEAKLSYQLVTSASAPAPVQPASRVCPRCVSEVCVRQPTGKRANGTPCQALAPLEGMPSLPTARANEASLQGLASHRSSATQHAKSCHAAPGTAHDTAPRVH